MTKKAKSAVLICNLPPFAVGTPVEIKRPHLWAGCRGVVEKYNETTTKHLVKIAGRHDTTFHAEAFASELQEATLETIPFSDFKNVLGL